MLIDAIRQEEATITIPHREPISQQATPDKVIAMLDTITAKRRIFETPGNIQPAFKDIRPRVLSDKVNRV
jgi:hypothetical protein